MSDIPTSLDSKEQPKSDAYVVMHKSQMANVKVGQPVTIKMKGTVKSIEPHIWDDPEPENFKLALGDIHAEHAAEEQENLSTMPKEQLKKRITLPED